MPVHPDFHKGHVYVADWKSIPEAQNRRFCGLAYGQTGLAESKIQTSHRPIRFAPGKTVGFSANRSLLLLGAKSSEVAKSESSIRPEPSAALPRITLPSAKLPSFAPKARAFMREPWEKRGTSAVWHLLLQMPQTIDKPRRSLRRPAGLLMSNQFWRAVPNIKSSI